MNENLCAIKPLKNCLILGCKRMTNACGISGKHLMAQIFSIRIGLEKY
jgi:hypothetical protein